MRALTLAALVLFALLATPAAARVSAQDAGWGEIYNRPSNSISHINMLDASYGLAIAGPGILRTTDGGRTWMEPAAKPLIPTGVTGIADVSHAWSVGFSGAIWRTDDGGLTWRKQASSTDAHLGDIAVVSATEAWVTGQGAGFSDIGPFAHEVSVLLHTTDAGETWRQVSMTAFGTFQAIEYHDGRLWITATQCREGDPYQDVPDYPRPRPACHDRISLLRSDDGGASWDVLGTEPALAPPRVQFLTRDIGFATASFCGGVSVCTTSYYATVDGGTTWVQRGPSPSRVVTDPHFIDANNAWASTLECGSAGCALNLYRSTDGARTWQLVTSAASTGYVELAQGFDLISPAAVIASGGPTGISLYDAASGTWTEATTDARPPLGGVMFLDGDTGYASGFGDGVAVTRDGGVSWQGVVTPSRFTELAVGGDGALWAAPGCNADPCPESVYRSVDGGRTWQEKHVGAVIGGLQAADARRAWVSVIGGLRRTDDGGDTWRVIDEATFGPAATFFDRDHGWTKQCGSAECDQAIRVTDDGGDTWKTLPLPENAQIVQFSTASIATADLYVSDPNDGSRDHFLISVDGGRTWLDRGPQPFYLRNPRFVDASRGWAIATDFYDYNDYASGFIPPSRIVATDDGGVTWRDEFALPAGGGGGFLAADERIWLMSSASDNHWSYGRTIIYRRDIDPAVPRITPPNTGGASHTTPGVTLGGLLAIAAGAIVLALLARRYRHPRFDT